MSLSQPPPLEGEGWGGDGLDSLDINPIPHLTSPFKGEEQILLALMFLYG